MKYDVLWVKICLTAGLIMLLLMTSHSTLGYSRHPTSLPVIFSMGVCEGCATSATKSVSIRRYNATAIRSIDMNMLVCVWQELNYHLDICCVTHSSCTECLWILVMWVNFKSFSLNWCLIYFSIIDSFFVISSQSCYIHLESPCIIYNI